MKTGIVALTALGCLTLGGCSYVTQEELKQVRLQAEEANSTAQQALKASSEAKDIASTSDERSRRTEVIIDRGFKRSMYK